MSKTIDQRVVEMQFDNQHFEKNVGTTLTTLDKLKRSLNLDGASKGLENINAAARNNDMGILSKSVETVGAKFSAMQVIGVTALANIANSAVNTGKRIVKALTIDPVKTGFQEYELKMGSVQTIMAGTGESLETVNEYLNELNKYSDQTIYSFQDMTSNIGKFTNAGVKLKDAVAAIKGVSNEAAISGANANEASRAMYNFAQALSTGSVKLIDWKSIENANMATVSFKEELIKTAAELGTIKKKGKEYVSTTTDMAGSTSDAFTATKGFNDSLSHQWMTSEVLIETLKKYSDTTTEIGKKATKAATEVKTFSMMVDTLKEAAQSGWATSWEIIFGDFNEGKKLWTSMANSIGAVIDKMSDVRNNFLKGAFWSPWKLASEHIEEAGISLKTFKKDLLATAGISYKTGKATKAFNKALKEGEITREVIVKTLKKYTGAEKEQAKSTEDLTAKLKKFQKIVDQVWRGDFGNGQKRVEALTKAGYKYSEVQGLVNKCVNGYRLKLSDLSSEQLKSIGYTDEQIKKIKKLGQEAETSGTDFNKLIENLSRPSGRELVLETVNKLLEEFSKITKSAGEAFDKVFGDSDASEGLYGFIEALHDLAENFTVTEQQAKNFERIFEGAFSGLQLTWNLAGFGLKSALKLISAVLELFGTDLLEVTAYVADLITKFNEWARSNTIWWGYINNLAKIIYALADGIYSCVKAFLNLDVVGDAVKSFFEWVGKALGIVDFKAFGSGIDNVAKIITKFFDNLEKKIKKLDKLDIKINMETFGEFIKYVKKIMPTIDDVRSAFEKLREVISSFFEWIGKAKDSENVGEYIVQGLVNGIRKGYSAAVEAIQSIGKKIIEAFCQLLGIHSPSTVFMAIGGFIITGLIYGLLSGSSALGGTVSDIVTGVFDKMSSALQNGLASITEMFGKLFSSIFTGLGMGGIDFGSLFVVGSMLAVVLMLRQLLKIMDKLTGITSPLKALADMFNGVTSLLGEFQKNVKAKRLNMYAEAIKSIAVAMAILVGSFYLLTKIDTDKVWPALGIMAALVAQMALLMVAANKLEPTAFARMALFMVGMSVAILIMAKAIKHLASVKFGDAMKAVLEIGLLVGMLAGLMYAYGTFVKGQSAKNIDKAAKLIMKIAVSLGLMALVFKIIGTMSVGEIAKGLIFVAGIAALYAGIIAISQFAGKRADKAARLIGKMGAAVAMMALAIKLIATMSWSDIAKGLFTIAGIEALFAGIIAVSKFAGENGGKAGRMLLLMSFAIGVMAVSIKLIAGIPAGDIQKGVRVIGMAMEMFVAFMIMSNFVGRNAGKAGLMLLGISAAILIMVTTIKLISYISAGDIAKGMLVIAGFEAMIAALIYVSKFAGKNADKAGAMLMKMSLSILILVGAIALLSIIKPEKVAIATAAIDSIMLCFVALVAVLKKANFSKDLMKNMIIMVATIGALAAVIGLLAQLNPENVIASAGSLSILLLSLSAAMLVLTHAKVSPATVGIAALMGLVLAELVGVLWLMKKLDVQPSIQASLGLVILLAGLAGVCYVMAGLGTIAVEAAIGIAAFGVLIAEMALVLAGLGALYKIPGLKEFIADGGNLLQSVGVAIGQFIGGIAGGIAQGATSTLPTIGITLSEFWANIKPFVDGVGTVDESTLTGMKNLAAAVLMLTGAGILDKLSSWVTGESSFSTFATELVDFGKGLKDFAAVTEGIDGDSLKNVSSAAKTVMEMANMAPNSGGLAGWLMGENDLGDFGTELVSFGESLAAYAESVSGITNTDGIEASVKVAKSLADLSESLPTIGGFWSKIVGEVDLETFGEQLVPLGESLTEFANNLGSFDKSKTESIKCAANAIKAMAKAGSEIDGQADWSKKLFGDNSLVAFGSQLPLVGLCLSLFAANLGTFDDTKSKSIKCAVNAIKNMAEAGAGIDGQTEWGKKLFGDNSISAFASQLPLVALALRLFVSGLGTFDKAQVSTIKCAANAIKAMAEAGAGIDGQTEWGKKLFGDDSLGAFSGQLGDVGTNLKTFVTNLGTFSDSQVTTIKSAVSAIKAFSVLAKTDLESMNANISGFSSKLPDFGKNISAFCANMPSGEDVNNAVKSVKSIAKMVKEVASSKITSVSDFTNSLGKMAKNGVSAFTKAFQSDDAASEAKKAVGSFISNAAKGMSSKKKTFQDAANKVADVCYTALTDKYAKFSEAGSYLVDGFCNGISANTYKARATAKAMADAAEEAAKEALDENSPSKVFYKIGDFAGLGFINGLSTYVGEAYDVSANVANSAKDGLNNAIKNIRKFVSEGVDVNPTITPVLDLSDVNSGVRAMNAMLDMGGTIGISSDVRAVNTMMNRRIQNGTNGDVISAINKLASKLGNIGGDSYTINGVTYDDGSNVSDAVKTLVRAAKVERRV